MFLLNLERFISLKCFVRDMRWVLTYTGFCSRNPFVTQSGVVDIVMHCSDPALKDSFLQLPVMLPAGSPQILDIVQPELD